MGNRFNMGSNRRKSRAQHERDGTLRKARHADLRNPEPENGRPVQPEGLSEAEAAEWSRVLDRLEQSDSLWRVHDGVIYQYCKLFAETEAVRTQQEEMKASVAILEENIRDVEKADLVHVFAQIVTLQKLISKATDQLRSGRVALRQFLGGEFGLSPAGRGRIKLPPKPADPQNALAAFQQARRSA
jgi:hypothetical protein